MLTKVQEQRLRDEARKKADDYLKRPKEAKEARPIINKIYISDVVNVAAYIIHNESLLSGGVEKASAFSSLAKIVGIEEVALSQAILNPTKKR